MCQKHPLTLMIFFSRGKIESGVPETYLAKNDQPRRFLIRKFGTTRSQGSHFFDVFRSAGGFIPRSFTYAETIRSMS
jgi:hypothetical protein